MTDLRAAACNTFSATASHSSLKHSTLMAVQIQGILQTRGKGSFSVENVQTEHVGDNRQSALTHSSVDPMHAKVLHKISHLPKSPLT